jgi:hypothetical protein
MPSGDVISHNSMLALTWRPAPASGQLKTVADGSDSVAAARDSPKLMMPLAGRAHPSAAVRVMQVIGAGMYVQFARPRQQG